MFDCLLAAVLRRGPAFLPAVLAVAWIAFAPFGSDRRGDLLVVALLCGYLVRGAVTGRVWLTLAAVVVVVGLVAVDLLVHSSELSASVLQGHKAGLVAGMVVPWVFGALVVIIAGDPIVQRRYGKAALVWPDATAFIAGTMWLLATVSAWVDPGMRPAAGEGLMVIVGLAGTGMFFARAGKRRPEVFVAVALMSLVALAGPHSSWLLAMSIVGATYIDDVALLRNTAVGSDRRADLHAFVDVVVDLLPGAAAFSAIAVGTLRPQLMSTFATSFWVAVLCGTVLMSVMGAAIVVFTGDRASGHGRKTDGPASTS